TSCPTYLSTVGSNRSRPSSAMTPVPRATSPTDTTAVTRLPEETVTSASRPVSTAVEPTGPSVEQAARNRTSPSHPVPLGPPLVPRSCHWNGSSSPYFLKFPWRPTT